MTANVVPPDPPTIGLTAYGLDFSGLRWTGRPQLFSVLNSKTTQLDSPGPLTQGHGIQKVRVRSPLVHQFCEYEIAP